MALDLELATLRPRSILASVARPELDDEAGQAEDGLKTIIDEVASP